MHGPAVVLPMHSPGSMCILCLPVLNLVGLQCGRWVDCCDIAKSTVVRYALLWYRVNYHLHACSATQVTISWQDIALGRCLFVMLRFWCLRALPCNVLLQYGTSTWASRTWLHMRQNGKLMWDGCGRSSKSLHCCILWLLKTTVSRPRLHVWNQVHARVLRNTSLTNTLSKECYVVVAFVISLEWYMFYDCAVPLWFAK